MHLALDGEGATPFAYFISRVCEEFGDCLPSVAVREWLTAPAGFIEEVIEARSYARVKSMSDNAKNKAELPKSPLLDLLQEIEFDLAAPDVAAAEAEWKAQDEQKAEAQ